MYLQRDICGVYVTAERVGSSAARAGSAMMKARRILVDNFMVRAVVFVVRVVAVGNVEAMLLVDRGEVEGDD